MRFKTVSYSLLSALIFLSSCNNQTTNEGAMKGIWSYTTLEGEYAEIWVNDNALLSVRNPAPRPAVFDYTQHNDTIKLYLQGTAEDDGPVIAEFYIQSREGDKLVKMQDGIRTELTLVDPSSTDFNDTQEFEDQVISDFVARASHPKE